MSRPNTMFQDTERDDVIPPSQSHPVIEDNRPGLTLELFALGSTLDEMMMSFADVKLAKSQDKLPALEAQLEKVIALASHARKAVTQARISNRKQSPTHAKE